MAKLSTIIDFSIILNRGYDSNRNCNKYFSTQNHPKLIESFIEYVNLQKDLIGLISVEDRQSISDYGCDIEIKLKDEVKIGVQIKSENDIKNENFAVKVKAQFAESHALGLDKYYILICTPVNNKTVKKINYILGNMATYKTGYHAVINPNNCLRIFEPGGKMPPAEFNRLKQLYSEEDNRDKLQIAIEKILKELDGGKAKDSDIEIAVKTALTRPSFKPLKSAESFFDFIGLNDADKIKSLPSVNEFITKYSSLNSGLRYLFFLIVQLSYKSGTWMDALEVNLHELQGHLNVSMTTLVGNLNVLLSEKYEFIEKDEDNGDIVNIFITMPDDLNLILCIKEFCNEKKIELSKILVDGEFELLN